MVTISEKRILIFIVAYNAEKTITSVLHRIPVERLPVGTEVLIIDDSSSDRTFLIAQAYKNNDVKGLKITVLINPENQGYGGNQKLGYQYAIKNGFDIVVLLHGDGQYAPERLPDLLSPILNGEADACLGSRMMERGEAVRNGMPFYKYLGNRILTFFQNKVLDMNLTEFHSGYRVYSVSALKKVPFKYNTNNFHFDTEIIIQFAMRGLRIKELPIPTYYGNEICYVNGLVYAWNVIASTLASRIHLMGLFFQRKFDVCRGECLYDSKLTYTSSHTLAISSVSPDSNVLDLTCGEGYVATELKKKGCKVTGIDKRSVEPDIFNKFILHDLDSPWLPETLGTYDYILALDCLEHLDFPENLLSELRSQCYDKKTKLIFTTPNIGFLITRFSLLAGKFNYGRQGILDFTHKRLFTFASFRRLLEQEGFKINAIKGIPAPFPRAIGMNLFSRFLVNVNKFLIILWRGMFSYQIYIKAEFIPPLDCLLKNAEDFSRLSS